MAAIHCFVDAGFVAVCSLYGAEEGLLLHDATPVRLRLSRNLSSADAADGETVDFDVVDEVKIGDALINSRGDARIATVTKAVSKKRRARSKNPNANIDYVRLVNGDKMALRAVKKTNGPYCKEVFQSSIRWKEPLTRECRFGRQTAASATETVSKVETKIETSVWRY